MKVLSIIFGLAITLSGNAQTLLTLDDAVLMALENNYQIRLQREEVAIAKKQINPALVGKSPQINLNASYEFGWSDAQITTLPLGPGENEPLSLNGISNDFILAPEVSMLLYGGKAVTYRLEALNAASQLNEAALQQLVEATTLQVSSLYLELARLQANTDVVQQSLALTQNRLDRKRTDQELGLATSLASLQIEVDLKADSVQLRSLVLGQEQLQRELNYLIGQPVETTFLVQTELDYDAELDLAALKASMLGNNAQLELQQKQIRLAELEEQLTAVAYKPTVSGYANFNFAYLQDDASFLQENRVLGPNIGLRANYLIYDGGARNAKRDIAQLQVNKQLLNEQNIKTELLKNLAVRYADYQNALRELVTERSNLPVFERNLAFIQDNYQKGQVTNTDVRSAQLALNATKNRINDYRYQLKAKECELRFLAGILVQ